MMKETKLHEINRYTDPTFPVGIYMVTRAGIQPDGRGYKDLHWHEELQFTFVERGELKIRIDGTDYLVKEKEAVFINRNLLHITTDLTKDGKYISLNFPDKLLSFFPGSRMEQDDVFPYTRGYMLPAVVLKKECAWQNEVLDQLQEILNILTKEEKEDGFAYDVAIRLVCMWSKFIRHRKSETVKPSAGYIRRQERMQQMLTFIHENYMHEIHLKDIANAAHVSVGECCRCFQNMVRTSPNQYLLVYRTEKSKEFLVETQMSVTEIAYATGFGDVSYFISYFRKCTGMTPGAYRSQKC